MPSNRATGNGHGSAASAASGSGGVNVGRDGDRVSLRMWGEHDLSTVDLLNTELVEAIAADDLDVVVDLSDVAFMDGSTVGVLVQGRALLAGLDRHLIVQYPTPVQRRLFQVCGLSDLIEPTPAQETAHAQRAATALETWVAVPPTARPARGSPSVEAEPVRDDDPERSRR